MPTHVCVWSVQQRHVRHLRNLGYESPSILESKLRETHAWQPRALPEHEQMVSSNWSTDQTPLQTTQAQRKTTVQGTKTTDGLLSAWMQVKASCLAPGSQFLGSGSSRPTTLHVGCWIWVPVPSVQDSGSGILDPRSNTHDPGSNSWTSDPILCQS